MRIRSITSRLPVTRDIHALQARTAALAANQKELMRCLSRGLDQIAELIEEVRDELGPEPPERPALRIACPWCDAPGSYDWPDQPCRACGTTRPPWPDPPEHDWLAPVIPLRKDSR